MASKSILCFGILFMFCYFSLCSNPKFACNTDWIYLQNAKRCLKYQIVPRSFENSLIACSSYPMGRLAKLYELDPDDKMILVNELDSGIHLWNTTSNNTCTVVVFENNDIVDANITEYGNNVCSNLLTFLCETSSYDRALGLENYEISNTRIMASSTYISPGSTALLEYRPEFVRLNTVFSKGFFTGKGWCSNSNSTKEFIEIDFGGTVELTGLRLQHGLINDCRMWVSKYSILYYKASSWKILKEGVSMKILNFSEHTVWLDRKLRSEKIRIKPLELNSSCSFHSNIYCLRMELFGKYSMVQIKFKERVIQGTDPLINTSDWPDGCYAIPKTRSGCPNKASSVSDGYNLKYYPNHLSSIVNFNTYSFQTFGNYFKENVCIHNFTAYQNKFPSGDYCILKYKCSCPGGFVQSGVHVAEYIIDTDGGKESLRNEKEDSVTSVLSNQYEHYCCRNDSQSVNDSMMKFSEPFFLYPIKNECQEFTNSTATMQMIWYRNITKPTFLGSITPYMNWDDSLSSLKQFICYYEPENNIDGIEIFLDGSENSLFANTEFLLRIRVKSNGRFVSTGVDSDQNFTIIGETCSNSKTQSILQNGSASITLMVCNEGLTTFQANMKTKKGLNLSTKIHLNFTKLYRVLVFINTDLKNENKSIDNYSNCSTDGMRLQQTYFHTASDLFKELQPHFHQTSTRLSTLNHMVVLSADDNRNTILSIAQGYKIPVLMYARTPEVVERQLPYVRYLSTSPRNSLFTVLSSISRENGVVIYRMENELSFAEYYSFHVMNITVLDDIILHNTIRDHHIQSLKSNPNCTVLLFIGSRVASLLLRKAIEVGVTPNQGYKWFSFSSNYVISNTFVREACWSISPPCHVVFKHMSNVFHESVKHDCQLLPSLQHFLYEKVGSSTQLTTKAIMDMIHYDMIMVSSEFVAKSYLKKSSLSWNEFINFIDSLECLPSGSGLKFYPSTGFHPNVLCQPGWSGNSCNVPVCSPTSCNATFGQCIAPERCKCNDGRYGRNCNGDCRTSCFHGVCNAGVFGDGKCKYCDWLYLGDDCSDKSIVYGFVAAGIGTTIVGTFLVLYIIKFLQTQEQTAEAEIEANAIEHTMCWDDLETTEDVDFSMKVTKKHLKNKLLYTTYKRGTTFTGLDVFIKCFQKPYFQLSLNLKTELNNLCKLDHENIERLIGLIIATPTVAIVTKRARMGSLYDVLHEKHIPITWDVKYSMMQDICRGMSYLHDVFKMEHGGLKSTNCLLHQGWLVKITDIGLKKLKSLKKKKKILVTFDGASKEMESTRSLLSDAEDDESDYASLLWTAPEYLNTGAKSLDQILRLSPEADVYSFGIIMAEIISRRPPFSECTVMSVPHIIQAIGHIREAILNLDQVNTIQEMRNATQNLQGMQSRLLRPTFEESLYPAEELERSILRSLMESCWSEEPKDRLPFAYSLEALELITPLKGSQTMKRAVLLERETDSLEQFIGHDTQQIFNEMEKFRDLLARTLPSTIILQLERGDDVKPLMYENVTMMVSSICNFNNILNVCPPAQAMAVIEYLSRVIAFIISHRRFNIMEINCQGDSHILASGIPTLDSDKHAYEIVTLATRLITASKAFRLPQYPDLKVSLRVGIHSGPVVAGIMHPVGIPHFTIFGEALMFAQLMEKECLPNYVHATKKTVKHLSHNDFDIFSRSSFKLRFEKKEFKTYWLSEK